MPAAAELQPPAEYADIWALLALGGLVMVVTYYVAVLWWTRKRKPAPAPPSPGASPRGARRRHLRELDAVERRVGEGTISAREGHQQISTTVRVFAQTVSGLPAAAMTLEALRQAAPRPLTDLVTSLYVPAFAGDEGQATDRFDETLERAREVVTSWS